MAPIRLLELRNTYKWGGGPDKTILLSAQQHDKRRVETVVAYIRDVNDHEFQITEMARGKGLTYYEIPERWKFDPRVVKQLRDLIIRYDINLVHGHDYKSDLFAFLTQRLMGERPLAVISTAHAWVMLGFKGELYRKMDLYLMKRFQHLIAVSQATKEEMMLAGIPGNNISVIHNGIDTETWCPSRVGHTMREELQLGNDGPVIGYVGRIMPEKDLETWLRAAALVGRAYPNARFVLVGEGRDGRTLQNLQELAVNLGIGERVIFPGFRNQLVSVYAAFDIFVMSSLREGLPNSILEAMAMHKPVVTTDVAGAKELVVHGETGFVVPQKGVEELAKYILMLLDNRELRLTMGRASRTRIETEFAFSVRLRRIEDLYERILGIREANSVPPIPAIAL